MWGKDMCPRLKHSKSFSTVFLQQNVNMGGLNSAGRVHKIGIKKKYIFVDFF